MNSTLRLEGQVTEDGQLLVVLPPMVEHGPVVVTVEPLPADTFDVTEDQLRGEGLTAAEIARAPEIGSWANSGVPPGEDYVEALRRHRRQPSW